ncbi:Heat shock 70 kDa protein 17 [Abeliophyllum distichum]|uniref:Heat shock 70 kDa protein 17 n=1 Tax=Abeliophyllum distichum TaxID=126358 RepID=A0ABD1RFW3_9LAMI
MFLQVFSSGDIVRTVGRFAGTTSSTVVSWEPDVHKLRYDITPDETQDVAVYKTKEEGGEFSKFTAEEMVAMILKYAMGLVENHARSSVKDVVITVPPYMGVAERRRLLTAADLAGINVLALVNEHSGTTLQYGIDKDFLNGTRHVMFYNMGSMHTGVDISV